MEIQVETVDQVTVVRLNGRLDSGTAGSVQEAIVAAIQPGVRLLVDMSEVGFMSSAGLRTLLLLNRNVSKNNGVIALVGVSQRLQDIMSMTGFLNFFTFYESVDDGIAAMRD